MTPRDLLLISRISRKRALAWSMLLLGLWILRLQAAPIVDVIEAVPIDRLIANLERQLKQEPRAIEWLLNLGRLHMMAYVFNSETMLVRPQTGGASMRESFSGLSVPPARVFDTAGSLARQHLDKAITTYKAAVAVAPSHVIARLGLAWCLQQSGAVAEAITGYRDVLKDVWPSSRDSQPTAWSNYNLAQEVSGYLLPLLDAVRDREEILQIQSRLVDTAPIMVAVSPVLIPLADALPVSELANRSASVLFDTDGNGIPEYRSWISPKAGWLVFDKHGRGQVDSGRSLFGNVTFWLFWDNGYHAMRSLDDDDDGRLSGNELEGLAIWRDANENGVSDPGEVRTLSEWGITSLSCRDQHFHGDPNVLAWSPEGVTFEDGRTRPTFDVLLFPADPTS